MPVGLTWEQCHWQCRTIRGGPSTSQPAQATIASSAEPHGASSSANAHRDWEHLIEELHVQEALAAPVVPGEVESEVFPALAAAAPSADPEPAAPEPPGDGSVIVEGLRARYDPHGELGQPGSYRRLTLNCPFHAGKGRNRCHKSRKWSKAFAEASGLGD